MRLYMYAYIPHLWANDIQAGQTGLNFYHGAWTQLDWEKCHDWIIQLLLSPVNVKERRKDPVFTYVAYIKRQNGKNVTHYNDVIMGTMASQITSLTIVYSTVYSDADQRKHQSCASLAFVREIHRGPVNFPHKWPVTWKIFPFDDVIMIK